MHRTRVHASILYCVLIFSFVFSPARAGPRGSNAINPADMKEWMGFLASDELDGRATFSEGLGIAAEYIAERLKSWGVKPGGDHGAYFQRVPVLGVKTADHSSIIVETNGQTRTFKTGEGIGWARPVGGKRSFTIDQVEFIGYGLSVPAANHDDYAGRNVAGKVTVWFGNS